jgi:hypothetical protein
MPSPFPGMDPWLEHPAVFPDIHDSLIIYMRDALNSQLPSPYRANTATRVWVEVSQRRIGPDVKVLRPDGPARDRDGGSVAVAEAVGVAPIIVHVPHDEMREPFVEIRLADGQRLVTAIEILSLTNKKPGEHGRDLYLKKQQEMLDGQVNLVEIDLLRGGLHTTAVPYERLRANAGAFDYHICIRRYDQWEDYAVYPWRLDQRVPDIAIPLLPDDAPVLLSLQPLLDRAYDNGRYAEILQYRERQSHPPPTDAQREWAEHVFSEKGL